jgi:hypothetical protein
VTVSDRDRVSVPHLKIVGEKGGIQILPEHI